MKPQSPSQPLCPPGCVQHPRQCRGEGAELLWGLRQHRGTNPAPCWEQADGVPLPPPPAPHLPPFTSHIPFVILSPPCGSSSILWVLTRPLSSASSLLSRRCPPTPSPPPPSMRSLLCLNPIKKQKIQTPVGLWEGSGWGAGGWLAPAALSGLGGRGGDASTLWPPIRAGERREQHGRPLWGCSRWPGGERLFPTPHRPRFGPVRCRLRPVEPWDRGGGALPAPSPLEAAPEAALRSGRAEVRPSPSLPPPPPPPHRRAPLHLPPPLSPQPGGALSSAAAPRCRTAHT